eukprot:3760615-Rhodomonas_salina.1
MAYGDMRCQYRAWRSSRVGRCARSVPDMAYGDWHVMRWPHLLRHDPWGEALERVGGREGREGGSDGEGERAEEEARVARRAAAWREERRRLVLVVGGGGACVPCVSAGLRAARVGQYQTAHSKCPCRMQYRTARRERVARYGYLEPTNR